MKTERHVRLFRNGRNQAVRIPRELELDSDEAIIRREDGRLVIEPVRRKGLLTRLAELSDVPDEFPDVDKGLMPVDDVSL